MNLREDITTQAVYTPDATPGLCSFGQLTPLFDGVASQCLYKGAMLLEATLLSEYIKHASFEKFLPGGCTATTGS